MADRRDPRTLLRPMTVARFWTQVNQQPHGGCWLWTGTIGDRGYGHFATGGINWQVHVLAYGLIYGPPSDDLTLDHVCHNADLSCPGGVTCLHRRCVHPKHLEQVTLTENVRRRARAGLRPDCVNGHPYTPENTYSRKPGYRDCRECNRIRARKAYLRQRATS